MLPLATALITRSIRTTYTFYAFKCILKALAASFGIFLSSCRMSWLNDICCWAGSSWQMPMSNRFSLMHAFIRFSCYSLFLRISTCLKSLRWLCFDRSAFLCLRRGR